MDNHNPIKDIQNSVSRKSDEVIDLVADRLQDKLKRVVKTYIAKAAAYVSRIWK